MCVSPACRGKHGPPIITILPPGTAKAITAVATATAVTATVVATTGNGGGRLDCVCVCVQCSNDSYQKVD